MANRECRSVVLSKKLPAQGHCATKLLYKIFAVCLRNKLSIEAESKIVHIGILVGRVRFIQVFEIGIQLNSIKTLAWAIMHILCGVRKDKRFIRINDLVKSLPASLDYVKRALGMLFFSVYRYIVE